MYNKNYQLALIACRHKYDPNELKNSNVSSWPALFAKHFNIDLINFGKSALSNDIILENILDQTYTKNDLVIVCFSCRRSFSTCATSHNQHNKKTNK
jgi:hypothetical protein